MGSRLELFRLLQGLISVYKSPGLDIKTLKRRIGKKLANGNTLYLNVFNNRIQ